MILELNAGSYVISDTITLPPNCYLKGAGKDRTVISKNNAGPAFRTVSNTNGNAASPTNVRIEDFSLNLNGASGFLLESCTDSHFNNISITGSWTDSAGQDDTLFGFKFDSLINVVNNNRISDVEFSNLGVAIFSEYDATNNKIHGCNFKDCYKALSFGILADNISVTPVGPNKNISFTKNLITENIFSDIKDHAAIIGRGNDNLFANNKFYDVNVFQDAYGRLSPNGPVIQFYPETKGNTSDADWFKRTEEFLFSPDLNHPEPRVYVPEIIGPVFFENSFANKLDLGRVEPGQILLKLPCDVAQSFEIDYIYNLYDTNNLKAIRKGTVSIAVDPRSETKDLTDDFISTLSNALGLRWSTVFLDQDNDAVQDSIGVEIENNVTSIENAELSFVIKTFR